MCPYTHMCRYKLILSYHFRTQAQFDRLTVVEKFITCLQQERNEVVYWILSNGTQPNGYSLLHE